MNPPTGPKAAWATERAILRFREMWAAGVPTQAMGDKLGVTKNAIVGMRKTLNLPERQSPIPRPEGWVPKWRPRVGTPNLAALDAPVEHVPAPVIADAPRPVITAPAPRPPRPALTSGRGECCWPIGEPRTRTFRFCDDRPEPGKPYCAEHCKLGFVKIRRETADATMGGDD